MGQNSRGELLMIKERTLTPELAVQRYPGLGCVGTLANWRSQKRGPKFYRVGAGRGRIVYRPEDIESYLFANPVKTIDSVKLEVSSGTKTF